MSTTPTTLLHNRPILRKLNRQAAASIASTVSVQWRQAYADIERGTALLAHLLEQSEVKPSPPPAFASGTE